jgi:uncharacterized protein YmfQ (DUF2313 family)
MTSNYLFKQHTNNEHRKSIADFLPNGELFRAKNTPDTNLYNLLLGLAYENARIENKMNEIAYQYDINKTTELIEQWESALGIPDDCFSNTVDINLRRTQVLAKLSLSIDTADSFVALAAEFGYTIEIVQASNVAIFPLQFPLQFYPTAKTARFTIIVNMPSELQPCTFPIAFPLCFSPPNSNIIECFFRKVKPANCQIVFKYIL